ncbi:EpsG family protein [Pedobacter miscanthi]|uniref:EpsG family protein n=1 Tax=Pedobacter miscanthi TaxID=2259170 RepID=UPI0013148BF0|nr:EpsG family protein [Pedobacter miscanthi]
MKKYIIFFISIFFWLITAYRLSPSMYDLGYDFISTQEQFPNDVASGYGIWNWLSLFISSIGLDFDIYWILISAIFGYSVYLYLKRFSSNSDFKQSKLLYFLLLLFLFGYVLPWYSFAHVRYGTAVLFSAAALTYKDKKYKYGTIFFAGLIHSLVFLFLAIYLIAKIKFVKKYFFQIMLPIGAISFFYKDKILLLMLSTLSYDNYTNDLLQFDSSSQNAIIVLRIIVISLAILFVVDKLGYSKVFLGILTALYTVLAILTPFSGRFVELLYPNILPRLKTYNLSVLVVFFILLLAESFFSIMRVIFHYDI